MLYRFVAGRLFASQSLTCQLVFPAHLPHPNAFYKGLHRPIGARSPPASEPATLGEYQGLTCESTMKTGRDGYQYQTHRI